MQLKWAESEAKQMGLPITEPAHANKLVALSLPQLVTEEQMEYLFRPYGQIRVLRIVRPGGKDARPRCYVKFATAEQAICAWKELNGIVKLPDAIRPLELYFCEQKRQNKTFFSTLENYLLRSKQGADARGDASLGAAGQLDSFGEKEVYYELKDAEGTPYYYHYKTKSSTWYKPFGPEVAIFPFVYKPPETARPTADHPMPSRKEAYVKVLVRNVPESFNSDQLKQLCANFVDVLEAKILNNEEAASMGLQKDHPGQILGLLFCPNLDEAETLVGQLNGESFVGYEFALSILV